MGKINNTEKGCVDLFSLKRHKQQKKIMYPPNVQPKPGMATKRTMQHTLESAKPTNDRMLNGVISGV